MSEFELLRNEFQAMRLDLALVQRDIQQIREQAMNHLPAAMAGLSRDMKDLDEKTERLFAFVSVNTRAHRADNGAGWRQAFYVVIGVLAALFVEIAKRLFE